jgi:hypothetical protein
MIDRLTLLGDLQKLLVKLQDDLRTRCVERPEVEAPLRAQYDAARAAKRTAEAYEAWREAQFTQAAVAWILSCVFIRFLEDNGLLGDIAYLSGPGPRLALARDQHTIYFRQHPTESDREYLYHVFRTVRGLPGLAALFHDTHNPVWHLGLSGDGAQLLLEFWQKLDAEEGQDAEHAPLVHDFSDPDLDTRFLGDLYQDLSEDAKKRFALLQTPIFIEEFILDRTLTPAIETFGYQKVRMIDPTCGSGHFALGGFHRLFALHQRHHPAVEVRALAQRALDQVFGVDLNPFAVAIARFRLLLAALHVCDIHRLADAPAFEVHVATGDSLLHGNPPGWEYRRQDFLGGHGALEDTLKHFYETEDAELARRYLSQDYHAVVGNPPYIIVKDKALNEAYRLRFESCHRKYSLAVPFMEQFFALAVKGEDAQPAGYVGMITSNSFMKREMGKKLIEQFIPRWNLTHVIDTAGGYIPGHGTPTVILFGTNHKPVQPTIRTVMGIKGEPATPDDPARGLVWTAIVRQVDHPGTESSFVSVADTARGNFHKHPWSIGGGGAAELKELLDDAAEQTLVKLADQIGIGAVTGEDELYLLPDEASARRLRIELSRPLGLGDQTRDWCLEEPPISVWLYDNEFNLLPLGKVPHSFKLLWRAKALISRRKRFGTPMLERGLTWYEWQELYVEKLKSPLTIAFGEVATHNHFILDRSGMVFKNSAQLIKLPVGASEADHLPLLGLLNSSTACFWLKQVCQNKGSTVDQHGARQRTAPFEDFFSFNGTKLSSFPIPADKPLELAKALDGLAQELKKQAPKTTLGTTTSHTLAILDMARQRWTETVQRMIALQEELDWECYRHHAVLTENVNLPLASPEFSQIRLSLGERAFEIVMARKMARGELETTWFERHGSTPITELPAHWPTAYRQLVERRVALIEGDRNLALIEQPEYKRRWNTEPWEQQQERALREWLLARLEDPRYWPATELTSCAHLADKVRRDPEFMEVATLYRNRPDFDLTELVVELVESESVPFLPVLRYKESGLRKRAIWEQVWDLQRREDAIDARTQLPKEDPNYLPPDAARTLKKQQVGDIPVPPKYDTKDFATGPAWRLRGKLDVPKERFITYPHCNRDADRTPVIGWAGWDPLQQAQAVAGYYERMRTNEGWTDDRLLPLLAGVLELLPWLLQWHNALDPQYGMGLGDFFRSFAEEEARRIGKTLDEVRAWKPPQAATRARRRTAM